MGVCHFCGLLEDFPKTSNRPTQPLRGGLEKIEIAAIVTPGARQPPCGFVQNKLRASPTLYTSRCAAGFPPDMTLRGS